MALAGCRLLVRSVLGARGVGAAAAGKEKEEEEGGGVGGHRTCSWVTFTQYIGGHCTISGIVVEGHLPWSQNAGSYFPQ